LAGLAGNKFPPKNLFQQFLGMKTFTSSSSKILYPLFDALYWATPGPATTSCV